MTGGGYAGKALYVDLGTGKVESRPLDYDLAEKYMGGLGLNIKIAADEIIPGTDPLSPGNPIVFGAGPLVGTNIPSTSRFYSVTKLPSSRTVGWGGGGSTFGASLKYAGLDYIVVTGKAEVPVILVIDGEDARITNADKFWGRGVSEATAALWDEFGKDSGVIVIGPAGEKLVSYSLAYVDRISTLGRGGLGAVMGSKNLKAVLVRGKAGVSVADRPRFNRLKREVFEKIRDYPHLKPWQDLGLLNSFPIVPADTYRKIFCRRVACISCPVGCKDVVRIPDGKFQGEVFRSSSAINLFTPLMYGYSDYREAIKLVSILDEYGIDMFEFFGVMGFAAALRDNGIITPDDACPAIVTNSLESMEAWAMMITHRRGLGEVLAGGFRKIIEEFGPESERLAPPLIKGMHPYAGPGSAIPWDLFGTMELGQVLDHRGPHVGSGGSPTYFAKRPLEVFPAHLTRMGVPEEVIPKIISAENETPHISGQLHVGRLLRYSHDWFTILGSLGICARGQVNRFYNAALCAQLLSAVTGVETDIPRLTEAAERAWNLLRIINLKEGISTDDESPPKQWFKDPPFREYITGRALNADLVREMIGDYYNERGWDPKTGIPTEKTLERLSLKGAL